MRGTRLKKLQIAHCSDKNKAILVYNPKDEIPVIAYYTDYEINNKLPE